MKKRIVATAIAAMLGLSAGSASAQGYVVNAQYLGTRAVTALNDLAMVERNGSGGGGFNYQTVTVNPDNLTTFVTYCFGANQYIQSPIDYRVLTFSEFVGWATRPSTYNQIDMQDLNNMAALVSAYTTGSATVLNGTRQETIWQIAMDNQVGPNTGTDFSNAFKVMIDNRLFASTNQIAFTAASQPFLVQVPGQVVPEPSTYALMAAGLVGLSIASRRRKLVS